MPYRVNLGCGARFDPAWVNIDMVVAGEGVAAHDLSRGIPLPDKSAEVVYHSHVLEHIPRENAAEFMGECFRVLRPRGVLRVAIPDLERICRTYLEMLDRADSGDAAAARDYQWIMLELYDQAVRNRPGGGMRDYIAGPDFRNADFVVDRIGEEARGLIRSLRDQPVRSSPVPARALRTRLRNVPSRLANILRQSLVRIFLGKKAARTFAIGRMRSSGEVHQWMYDRYSLRELLESVGFREVVQMNANESHIPDWVRLNLDTDAAGASVKPDSLYMEAVRPLNA